MNAPIDPKYLPPEDHDPDLCWPLKWGVYTYRDPKGTYFTNYKADYTYFSVNFNSKKEAEAHVYHNLGSGFIGGQKLMVVPLPWRTREGNLQRNERTLPVWVKQNWWKNNNHIWNNHYVHVSQQNRSVLAYTMDANKGMRDIQTQIKAGRYLSKYFGSILTEAQIAFNAAWQNTGVWVTEYSDEKKYGLFFATTPDDIERIYLTGPKSCMSYRNSHYQSKVHPSRVYGAGDLAIAYLKAFNPQADSDKPDIVARTLCWPENLIAGRVYPTPAEWRGDNFESEQDSEAAHNALKNRLTELGYTFLSVKEKGFDGAKLLKIANSARYFVMPYLDNSYAVKQHESKEFFKMAKNGGIYGGSTTGVIEVRGVVIATCDRCHGSIYQSESINSVVTRIRAGKIVETKSWCTPCQSCNAFYCHGLNADVSTSYNKAHMINGDTVAERWAELNCHYSDYSRCYFQGEKIIMANGQRWSGEEFDNFGFTCEASGDKYHFADKHWKYPTISSTLPKTAIEKWLAADTSRIEDPNNDQIPF